MVIGLTGTSGSGKSTACKIFEELGFLIIDFDKITHSLYENSLDCIKEIADNFEGVVIDNTINRKALALIVFNDKEKLELLNRIVHKYIMAELDKILKTNKGKDIILDAPLLFEASLDKICDYTLCVTCDFEKKSERIMKRDNLTFEEAQLRLKNQKDDAYFVEKCDFTLDNNTNICKNDVIEILNLIKLGGEDKK